MAAEQPSVDLTTRDVFQQVDRRLSLIEGDLRSLDAKLEDKIDGLGSETSAQNSSLRSEMTAGFARVDTKFDTQFGSLRSEMTVGFARVDTKIDTQFGSLRSETKVQFDSLRSETKAQFDSLRSEMTAGFARADTKSDTLDVKFDTLHLDTKQDTHTLTQDMLSVRQEIRELELRLKHDLTLRLGGMMVVGITVVATLVKLL